MVPVRVRDHAYLMTTDINLDQRTDARTVDGLVNRCIAAVYEALRSPTAMFTERDSRGIPGIRAAIKNGPRMALLTFNRKEHILLLFV